MYTHELIKFSTRVLYANICVGFLTAFPYKLHTCIETVCAVSVHIYIHIHTQKQAFTCALQVNFLLIRSHTRHKYVHEISKCLTASTLSVVSAFYNATSRINAVFYCIVDEFAHKINTRRL
jgi:hypothetical protein